jgi:hypothetical protein
MASTVFNNPMFNNPQQHAFLIYNNKYMREELRQIQRDALTNGDILTHLDSMVILKEELTPLSNNKTENEEDAYYILMQDEDNYDEYDEYNVEIHEKMYDKRSN